MKVADRVDLKSSHHKKKICQVWWWMLTRHCDNHFGVYTNIESLCYIPQTNIMLYATYISNFKKIKLIDVIFRNEYKANSHIWQNYNADKTAKTSPNSHLENDLCK